MLPGHKARLASLRATLEALQRDWKEAHTASTAVAAKLQAVQQQVQTAALQDMACLTAFGNHFNVKGEKNDVSVYKHIQNILDSNARDASTGAGATATVAADTAATAGAGKAEKNQRSSPFSSPVSSVLSCTSPSPAPAAPRGAEGASLKGAMAMATAMELE